MKFTIPGVVFAFVICICAPASQSAHKNPAVDGPGSSSQVTFLVHRLGTDHAEGITTLDMNGDGRTDLVSGAYWYENPGAAGVSGSGINTVPSAFSGSSSRIAENGHST